MLSALTASIFLTTSLVGGVSGQEQIPLRAPEKPDVYYDIEKAGGSIRSIEYKSNVTFTIEDGGPSPDEMNRVENCTHQCQGKVHSKHDECDASCDVSCAKEHEKDGEPARVRFLDPRSTYEGEKLAFDSIAFVSLTRRVFAVAEEMKYRRIVRFLPKGHFADHCNSATREYKFKRFKLRAVGKVEYFRNGWDTVWTTMNVNHVVAYIDILDTATPPKEQAFNMCRCLGQVGLLQPDTSLFCAGPVIRTETGQGFQNLDPKTFGLTFTGQNLTTVNVGINQLSMTPATLYLPPGCALVSQDPKVQNMVNLVGRTLEIPGKSTPLSGPAAETSLTEMIGSMRVACAQMTKKEPDSTTQFAIKPIQDSVLARLAEITNKSRFRGPADQARIWIYTDQASLAEMNKVMMPGISVSRYVGLLHEIHDIGHVSMYQPRFQKCFAPELLLCPDASQETIHWLFARLRESDAKKLAMFIKSGYSQFAAQATTKETDLIAYFATVLDCISQSPEKDIHSLASDFVAKAIPDALRERALAASTYGEWAKALTPPRENAHTRLQH